MTDDPRSPGAETERERPSLLASDFGGVVFLLLTFFSLAIPLGRALLAREAFGWAATVGLLSLLAIPLLLAHVARRRRRAIERSDAGRRPE